MSTVPGSRKPHPASGAASELRVLVTAGPTHEPIDAVRYLANRSSGRMGVALAEAAHAAGAAVTLLLGPIGRDPQGLSPAVAVERFESSRDLEALLLRRLPEHDCLVMAAAVADYRPAHVSPGKLRRTGEPLVLELEPVPDLLAAAAAARRPGHFLVGFALGSAATLEPSAREKLRRKGIDAIVANELATMGSETVSARLILADGRELAPESPGPLSKRAFADWLMATLLPPAARRRAEARVEA